MVSSSSERRRLEDAPGSGGREGRRVGLLGGTFDPPHVGHLVVAREVSERLELDELLFVVAARSPQKMERDAVPGEVRARMVEAAIEGEPDMGVSRIELERGGVSFTVETLRALVRMDPTTRWYLLLGADQFAAFDRWREPEAIAGLARLVVFDREGRDPEEPSGIEIPFERVDVTRIDVSSSELRRRVGEGRSVRWLVPEGARKVMIEEGLYIHAAAPEA